MDAQKCAEIRPALLLTLALLAATGLVNDCPAGGHEQCAQPHHGPFFDGTTKCRWQRTWHGPNAIWTPLNPYFIPRPADPCKYVGYGRDCYANGCGVSVEEGYFSEDAARYEDADVTDYGDSPALPLGLERLGQIPNDIGIAGGAPTAAARPAR
jgi:hypothetical protein